jgi:hypothetical protein
MLIEELHLISFKGFSDFKLKCSQFTTLVGMNSSGKTSIFQAIQFVHDVFRFTFGGYSNPDIQRPDFTTPHWSTQQSGYSPEQMINRLNSGDPDALWLNKKTSTPCELSLKLSGGIEIRLEITNRSNYILDLLVNDISVKNRTLEPEYQKLIEDFFSLSPTFVPPTASLPPLENFVNYPELRQKLDKGLVGECWRSYLFWLSQSRGERESSSVVEIVQRYLPNTVLRLPGLSRHSPSQVLIEFEENETAFDISVSGGGLRTIASLAVILHFARSKCLLLDEPDAHLHSTLQHQVAQMLIDHAFENNVQVFVTSHAPDFIAEIPVEYLTWIDRTKRESLTCNEVGRFLADLGAVTKADAIRNYGANKILFIEGELDRTVISQLVACYCQESSDRINPFTDSSVIIAELPNGKGDRKHLAAFQKLLSETFKINVKIACIVDNDYDISHDDSLADVKGSTVLLLQLKRKEIENYLLDSHGIFKAVANLLEKRRERVETTINCPTVEEIQTGLDEILNKPEIRDTVKYQVLHKYREELDDKLDNSTKDRKAEERFNQEWSDEDWRIRNCPGKEVLKGLRKWCKDNYSVTLTDSTLIMALQQCPDDLRDIIGKLQEYFYSAISQR